MQIRGWHIDGFGVLHDYRVDDIPAGLTVFSGPNEAGKSTLLAFIRGMMFGFVPGPAGTGQYPPLRGGRHGGEIVLGDQDGTTHVIERYAGRRGVRATREGQPVPDDTLSRLLGGMDRHLFDAVFAFNLADLQALEHLGHAEIQEHLALTGIAGAARSPAEAIRALDARLALVLQDSRPGGRGERGLDSLDALTARLDRARAAAAAYDDVRREEAEAQDRITALGGDVRSARASTERATLSVRLWPAWQARREAVADLGRVSHDDAVAASAADIDHLAGEVAAYEAASGRLAAAAAARDEAVVAVEARLRDLGPDWDRARLRMVGDTGAARQRAMAFADRLDQADRAADVAAREVLAARGRVSREVRQRAELDAAIAAMTAGIDEGTLVGRQAAIRRMRARRADLTSGILQVQVARTTLDGLEELRFQTATAEATGGIHWLGRSLTLAGLVLLAAAVWTFIGDDVAPAVSFAIAGVVALLLGTTLSAQMRRSARERSARQARVGARYAAAMATLEEQTARLTNVRTAMAADASAAGCSPEPTGLDLEEADRRATDALQTLRQAEDRRGDLAAAVEREHEALAAVDVRAAEQAERASERAAVAAEWTAWLSTTPLPSSLPPHGVLDFLDLIDSGRQRLADEETTTDEATTLWDTVERVESGLAGLAGSGMVEADPPVQAADDETSGSRGSPPRGTAGRIERGPATVAAVRELVGRLAAERENRRQRDAIAEAIRAADAQIEAIAGGGDLDATVARLADGDPESWRREIEATERAEREATDALATARQRATEAAVRLRAMEASTEVADLELERNATLAEREVSRREATVLAMAGELLREMVARVERERQPEVLRQASGSFERITGGQYRRVFRAVGASGDLAIEARDGSIRSPEVLSRGTLEQLYLALRLGLATAFTSRVGTVPLVLDDVLVNFDPERAMGVARALQDVARGRQVLLFTSQPGTVEMMRSVEGAVAHFAMARHGTGGEWVERQ